MTASLTSGLQGSVAGGDAVGKERVVVRVTSQRGPLDSALLASHMPGSTLEHEGVRFTVDEEPSDVVVVLNYLKYDTRLSARDGYVFVWHNEPIVRTPFPKGFDRVYSHVSTVADDRLRRQPPVLDWWVNKSFDELKAMRLPKKDRLVSAIASTKEMIDGHRRRNEFIELIRKELPAIDIYGEGRPHALDDKWDGLAGYRYSIAIENTSKPDYWTEKIADCFLAGTVPFYFGATNIFDYFPQESVIWLPLDTPDKALKVLQDTLANDDYSSRKMALREARQRVLGRYSLFAQLTRIVEEEREQILRAPIVQRAVHGRRVRRGGWIRGVGLGTNLQSATERLTSRLNRLTSGS